MKKIAVILSALVTMVVFNSCSKSNHYNNQKPITISLTNKSTVPVKKRNSKAINSINVAISTMISPKKTFYLYENLLRYIEDKLGIPINLKQRKTYQEVNELLEDGKLDFAYVCSGAYVVARNKFPLKILAAPVINGTTTYNAYIIVNKSSGITDFEELKGKSFAFSDPLSNTGYKYVIKLLKEKKTDPRSFFSKTIFTYAHDYSIQTVERGLVDGATVDGLVYDYLMVNNPERLKNVKIIYKSPSYGIPPFVYTPNSNIDTVKKIQSILLNMNKDAAGKRILSELQIDKFVIVNPNNYNSLTLFN